MNNNLRLLKKFESGTATWNDYSDFLKLNLIELESFFKLAYNLKNRIFGDILKIYTPGTKFPAISITGSECALECEHCNKKYLKGMKPILNNFDLEKFLLNHSKNEGVGVLISGGCASDGSLPLLNFMDAIKEVKKKTNLIINTHTGLLNEETAKKLAESKVDIVSFDINLDEDVIREIYHLNKNLADYKNAIEFLKKNELNIIPHICIGLYYGKIHKELESIRFIKESGINPPLIVVIALIPPKKSKIKFERLTPIDIARIIMVLRFVFPNTEISLGCMRPRGEIKVDVEKNAIKAGITRIEIPSSQTLRWLKEEYPELKFKFYSACCAIPVKFEKFAKSEESDLKNYKF